MLIETLVKPLIGVGAEILRRAFNRPRLKLFCSWSHEPNGNGVGNYLALKLKIANPASEAIHFERLEAVDSKGSTFSPLFFGVAANTSITPKTCVVGKVPCGHVRSGGLRELRVVDSLENVYSLKGRKLRRVVVDLIQEIERLESLNLSIHPTSPYPE